MFLNQAFRISLTLAAIAAVATRGEANALAAQTAHASSSHEHADQVDTPHGNGDTAAHAEDAHHEAVNAARPGLAESTETVGRSVFHFEGGYSLVRVEGENSHSVGEAMLRYGVSDWAEVRALLGSYSREYDHGDLVTGFEDVVFQAKANVYRSQGGVAPSVAVIAGTGLPTGSDHVGSGDWTPVGAASLEWALPAHLSVTTTAELRTVLGEAWDHGELTSAVELGFPVVPGVHGHVEYAAIALPADFGERLNHFSAGLGYEVSEDLVLDLWGGYASHHGEGEALFGLGFARRW